MSEELDQVIAAFPERKNQGKNPAKKKKTKERLGTPGKTFTDPYTEKTIDIPQNKLPMTATPEQLRGHVNDLTAVVKTLAQTLTIYRHLFAAQRRSKNVDLNIVSDLASQGASQRAIATSMGFGVDMFKQRQDVLDAFRRGRAEMEVALAGEQVQTAFGKHGAQAAGTMQIFLGKQYLDQKPDSVIAATQVNVNVNVDGAQTLREKIKAEHAKLNTDVIDAEFTESGAAMVDKSP